MRPETTISLAQDQTLESGEEGEEKTYWSDASTWKQVVGADSVTAYVDVLSVSSNAKLRIVGQWSLDGKNWTDFASDLSPSGGITSTGSAEYYYAGGVHAFEFGPYVRFGAAVSASSGSAQEKVRAVLLIAVDLPGADPTLSGPSSPTYRLPIRSRRSS